ncbi:NCS2 family permease [uncultured Bartonella sp.]|uniref:NCS2 family permease n=1 Tax=uncultured Bartonella sp. TaxID=104108 RepID=UPI00260B6AF1|nr:NCS2 family permease [uncultured Bartonella sp.]
MLEKLFHLKENNTRVRVEIGAGLTTFLTMSYILAVNPNILGAAGMDKGAVFVATCIAAAVGSVIMGLLANWPIGMAPGMGLNVFFAYTVVITMGYSWQQALGAVFLSGIVFLVLTATGVRQWLIAGVPRSLRSAIAAGIGMFLAIVAFQNAGIVVKNDATLVGLGDVTKVAPVLAAIGLFIIVTLDAFKIRGGILAGIIIVTILSFIFTEEGYRNFRALLQTGGISLPPSVAPTFLQLDIAGVLHTGIFHVLLVFVLVEIFDATGTLVGVGKRAGLIPEDKPNNLGKALFADSTAILAGSLIGTSSTTAYVESASGVTAGGRTGLTAITIAAFFVLALFFSPIALAIPAYATAPALIFVACLMMREFVEINWNNIVEAVPAALTALLMPFTYSIANGLAFGFISYAVLKTLTGKWRDVHPATWIIALLFILRFLIEGGIF